MIEYFSKKRMIFGILVLITLTIVVLFIESEWDLITPKAKNFIVENNSTCYLREEYEVISHCAPCSSFEIKLAKTQPGGGVCHHTNNKEVLKCQSGEIVIKSCDKVAFLEKRNYYIFMSFAFLIATFSSTVVYARQRILDRNFFNLLLERRKGTNEVTIESFVALTLLKFLEAEQEIGVEFIESDSVTSAISINYTNNYRKNDEKSMKLPMLKINDGNYNIIGLCSVLRGICRIMQTKNEAMATKLLGFKENCLLSASTTSLWVSFCEQDIITCLKNLMKLSNDDVSLFPLEILKLECEFNNPVRMHNVFKVVREAKKDKSIQSESATKVDLEHKYCHGNEANLSDFILYVIFKLIFLTVTNENFQHIVPHIFKWYNSMDVEFSSLNNIIMTLVTKAPQKYIYFKKELPVVEANGKYFSLFKRQLVGHKMKKCKSLTNQNEIDLILAKLEGLNVDIKSLPGSEEGLHKIDDKVIEDLLNSGEFPQDRMDRKKSQLKSFVCKVMKIAQDDDTIVDFCSGTGHVGLLIALMLPQCKVIILENKEESIKRANEKANKLQLHNVTFYQCNLEYFNEHFTLGVSLHACGIATDLVLDKCYKMKANFVSSPCCYGKIQDLGNNLPQSHMFRTILSGDEVVKISHCSDQTHNEKNVKHINLDKARQGYFCMDIIDTDRSLKAQELGYKVELTRLYPEDCTLKNRLLIGIHPR